MPHGTDNLDTSPAGHHRPKLGGLFDGAFHVLMYDGSVKRIRKDADPAILKKVIMPADGWVIDFSKIEK